MKTKTDSPIDVFVIAETVNKETRYKVLDCEGNLWWDHRKIWYPSADQIGRGGVLPLNDEARAKWLKWTSPTPEQALIDHAPLHETDFKEGEYATQHYKWVLSTD
jgi:hypothetical protein